MVISILRKEEMVISDYGKIVGLVPGHDFILINKRFWIRNSNFSQATEIKKQKLQDSVDSCDYMMKIE